MQATVHGVAKSQARLSEFSSLHFTSEELKNKHAETNDTITEIKNYSRRNQEQNI